MTFTKLVDLLSTSSLFMATADIFEDNYEGSISLKSFEKRSSVFRQLQKEIKESLTEGIHMDNISASHLSKDYVQLQRSLRPTIGINCWHMNDHESAAMWNLYSHSGEGIAIQSTYQKLIDSLATSDISSSIGTVKYINYETDDMDFGSLLSPFLHKRKSFEHERELRLVSWTLSNENKGKINFEADNKGFKILTNLAELIEVVYVSPKSAKWFTDLVGDILKKYGLITTPVKNSGLNGSPIF
jgi:hypothetical protein